MKRIVNRLYRLNPEDEYQEITIKSRNVKGIFVDDYNFTTVHVVEPEGSDDRFTLKIKKISEHEAVRLDLYHTIEYRTLHNSSSYYEELGVTSNGGSADFWYYHIN